MTGITNSAARLCLVVPAAVLLPQALAAQDLVPADPAYEQPAPAPAPVDAAYLALGEEILRLNDRIAALERLVSQLVSQQDEDQRGIAVLTDELGRFRADIETRVAGIEAQPPVAAAPAPAVAAVPSAPPAATPPAPVDRFEQAMAFARKEDWPSAELALSTFIANNPDDPRLAEARYQLGLAYLGQGQAGQAAGIFLDLFETGAAAAFGADNLFALARALRALEDVDPAQVCSVYSEIDVSYGGELSPARREELLDLRLAGDCGE